MTVGLFLKHFCNLLCSGLGGSGLGGSGLGGSGLVCTPSVLGLIF